MGIENSNQLDITWGKIIIIDCLSEEERNDWRVAEDLVQFLKNENISTDRYMCPSKKAFIESCDDILTKAEKGGKFCLHIVAHGNENGIGISTTNEPILWVELEKILNDINCAMSGQLLLNMTSCKGLHSIKIVDKLNSKPFFGLIGYADDLYTSLGKLINKLFYSKIAEGKPIQTVISEIQTELDVKDKLGCISTQGYNFIKNTISNKV